MPSLELGTEVPYRGTPLERVIEEQVAIFVSDIRSEVFTTPELNARMNPGGLQSAYVAPLSTPREKLGVLVVNAKQD
jgi:hypothetical protein